MVSIRHQKYYLQLNMEQATKLVMVRLNVETKNKLENLSKIKFKSAPWLIMKAIEDYINKEETKEKLKQGTLSRWQEAEMGNVVSQDKAIEWLRSWGKDKGTGRP